MSNRILSNEDFLMIARDLEIHHSVFAKLWSVGKPSFSEEIPTAAVTFDRNGNHLDFKFNPKFWDERTPYERNFIICHECMHIILNHGNRLKTLNKDLGNVAADVVINEMLVAGFGFNRKQAKWLDENACWIDTSLKDVVVHVDEDRSLEYYYLLLKRDLSDKIKEAIKNGKLKIVDSHEGMGSIDSKDLEDVLGDVLDSMNETEKESLDKTFNDVNNKEVDECNKVAGTVPGKLSKIIKLGRIKKKKKWETVIKRWANKFINDDSKDLEQWARMNRRFMNISTNLFLPSEMEIEEKIDVKKKIKVAFFQDTSGSCSHLAERFFKAAKTLPTNRFEIELYCFDTEVYKTSLASGKLYGFGGTSFSVIEEYVFNTIAKGDLNAYPKAIWIVSDGYGDTVNPRKPKNWYWFLSENYTNYIPKECNIFMLKDFE
jgi:predicted metal-dependent peptidase